MIPVKINRNRSVRSAILQTSVVRITAAGTVVQSTVRQQMTLEYVPIQWRRETRHRILAEPPRANMVLRVNASTSMVTFAQMLVPQATVVAAWEHAKMEKSYPLRRRPLHPPPAAVGVMELEAGNAAPAKMHANHAQQEAS